MIYLTAFLAALLHFKFFLLESVFWGRPRVNRIFKLAPEVAHSPAVRTFAFNMGFYNLFLSLGTLAGLALLHRGCSGGVTLLAFCTSCMVAAGGVLLISGGLRRLPAALAQAVPPAVCLYAMFMR